MCDCCDCEEKMRIIQAAVGQWMVAMRNWNLAEDDAIEHLVEKCKELDAEVKRLTSIAVQYGEYGNDVA